MKKWINITIFSSILCLAILIQFNEIKAQSKGETIPNLPVDTAFIFTSPRPLINNEAPETQWKNAWGVDVLFSNNGFGMGIFYNKLIKNDLYWFTSLYISGARNTDEMEVQDPITYDVYIPGKINRLFMFPLTIGLQKFVLTDFLTESLKPFISAGIGPTLIISTPYSKEFFSAFGDARAYGRFSTFVGVGAYFGSFGKSIMGVNLRYYYIPFGGNGLESVINSPIKDFGGVFLSLTFGGRF